MFWRFKTNFGADFGCLKKILNVKIQRKEILFQKQGYKNIYLNLEY